MIYCDGDEVPGTVACVYLDRSAMAMMVTDDDDGGGDVPGSSCVHRLILGPPTAL